MIESLFAEINALSAKVNTKHSRDICTTSITIVSNTSTKIYTYVTVIKFEQNLSFYYCLKRSERINNKCKESGEIDLAKSVSHSNETIPNEWSKVIPIKFPTTGSITSGLHEAFVIHNISKIIVSKNVTHFSTTIYAQQSHEQQQSLSDFG
ncbi:hypothetical protein ACTXT7_003827 [Hymenolepis weldensis]